MLHGRPLRDREINDLPKITQLFGDIWDSTLIYVLFPPLQTEKNHAPYILGGISNIPMSRVVSSNLKNPFTSLTIDSDQDSWWPLGTATRGVVNIPGMPGGWSYLYSYTEGAGLERSCNSHFKGVDIAEECSTIHTLGGMLNSWHSLTIY